MAPKDTSGIKAKSTSRRSAAKVAHKGDRGTTFCRDHGQKGDAQHASTIPFELQQLLVNIFKDSFSTQLMADMSPLFQEVKQHLFNRNFAQVFGSQKNLDAYAIRWSPSRALAYLDIFCNLPYLEARLVRRARGGTAMAETIEQPSARSAGRPSHAHVDDFGTPLKSYSEAQSISMKTAKIACLGGGAGAEMIALAGYARHMHSSLRADSLSERKGPPIDQDSITEDILLSKLVVTLVDIAGWSSVVRDLFESVIRSPPVSKYASSAAKAANAPLVASEDFCCTFHQQDLLGLDVKDLAHLLKDTTLITIMFTLNELYSESMVKTTNLLLALTYLSEKGTLLLVVDSPGSYSTVAVGSSADIPAHSTEPQKKYPMQWLLDHTLLEASTIGSSKNTDHERQWERLVADDSRWFRLPDGLHYPIGLENMRYQMHLYRRL